MKRRIKITGYVPPPKQKQRSLYVKEKDKKPIKFNLETFKEKQGL